MKGYKASYENKCGSLTYEVGKTYIFNGKLIMGKQGFHFCENPKDTLDYYSYYNECFELLEVEAVGEIIPGDHKQFLTNKIKIIRVVPKSEYENLLDIVFDSNNNVIRSGSGDETFLYEYDENNNLVKLNKYGKTWIFEYDKNNNRTKNICPDGTIYEYKYDEKNNLVEKKCEDFIVRHEYDENNNLIRDIYVCGFDSVGREYKYDKNNHLIEIEKIGSGLSYQCEYDEKGNKIKETSDNLTLEFEYDANNNLIKESCAKYNYFYEFQYDKNDNLIKRMHSDGYIWEYDKKGNVIKETKPDGESWSITIEDTI